MEAPVVASVELLDVAVQLDRQLERLGVPLEVGDHLVARRVAVRVARKRKPRKRAVAAGREERQRIPALAPGRRDLAGALEDHEAAALAAEEVADRQPRLTSADDRDFHIIAQSRRCAGLARGTAHNLSASRYRTTQTRRQVGCGDSAANGAEALFLADSAVTLTGIAARHLMPQRCARRTLNSRWSTFTAKATGRRR